ncbi:PhnB protein [Stackebrandtia endophytica]|uniref:PhnB protein n=1 Tax=Stackebrandtia endophytica TaxID=1496996 RepID=A0A543AWA2_9ACTN|nr:VOC family protein [Stackebrandtia endophytica]TQL76866.1 PhnB protein [Stackebrandtia endophytica]
MGSHLNPYLGFTGDARQAMEFYRDVFGGELELGTVADFGSPDAPNAEAVMHARLDTTDGYTLMAWDVPAGFPHQPGNNVAVYLGGGDELRGHFERLAVGGTVTMPLDKQAWGDEAGSLVDRFGVNWMVNIPAERP